ncbi:MAG: flagellar hook-length control protein FliK, partial [Janthinobacterium lividum]
AGFGVAMRRAGDTTGDTTGAAGIQGDAGVNANPNPNAPATLASDPASLLNPAALAIPGAPPAPADASSLVQAQAQPNAPAPQTGWIDTPFVDARWSQAFSQNVVMMARGNTGLAELHLNPPNLGPIRVSLNLQGNDAQATFSSHDPQVRDAIAAALPQLRERFAEGGLSLAQANVTPNAPPDGALTAWNGGAAAGGDPSRGNPGRQGNPGAYRDAGDTGIGGTRSAAPALTTRTPPYGWANTPVTGTGALSKIDTFA